MIENRYLTQEILDTDCIGDSVAKQNYNLLSLDTNICNLSSLFFEGFDSYYNVFSDFISYSAAFVQFISSLDIDRNNTVYTAVNLLSSYWNSHEFFIYYPFNTYINDNTPANSISVNQTNQSLISLANSYLNNTNPPYYFPEGTIANVVFSLYNVPLNPNNPDDLVTSNISPSFSFTVRNMYGKYKKQDVFFKNNKIIKFYRSSDDKWSIINIETGTSDENTSDITKLEQVEQQRILVKPPSGRSTINLIIDSNTYNYDVFYNAIKTGLYYTGFTDINVTIGKNVFVGSTSYLKPSIFISNLFVNGDTVTIKNYGNIYGCGGDGGAGQNLGEQLNDTVNGKNGGDALSINFPTTIDNLGVIAGGGGGGAGQKATYSDKSYLQLNRSENIKAGDGGGGGAGFNSGVGGKGGNSYKSLLNPQITYNFTLSDGANGTNGGLDDGGYSLTAGSGGSLGKKGSDTGALSNGTQLPPYAGDSGNFINGLSYVVFANKGTLLGKAK